VEFLFFNKPIDRTDVPLYPALMIFFLIFYQLLGAYSLLKIRKNYISEIFTFIKLNRKEMAKI